MVTWMHIAIRKSMTRMLQAFKASNKSHLHKEDLPFRQLYTIDSGFVAVKLGFWTTEDLNCLAEDRLPENISNQIIPLIKKISISLFSIAGSVISLQLTAAKCSH